MSDRVRLEGPVELLDGKLVLLIPMDAGGSALVECSKGIASVDGDVLKVTIPEWLAAKLDLQAGTLVTVDNLHGKFNLRRVG